MRKTVTISVPHHYTKEEARRRIVEGIASHKEKFAKVAQVEETWAGDHMEFKASAMGQSLTGRADVTADAVVIHVDLPMMLAMMAGRIKGEIEGETKKMLEGK